MRAPKLIGDTWFNTRKDLTGDLKGKIVLYDFWTYSCVNCQRTLPYLKQWWAKYKDMGFTMIGIHTPEFEFEKDPKNVKQAIKDFGVEWPVVLDSDFVNWKHFANHYWPAKYLADKDGRIVYTHFGEGNYAETEKKIQELLGKAESMPAVLDEGHNHGNVCFIATPELYSGYSRGRLSNYEGYAMDRVSNYEKPKSIEQDSIGLSGSFVARAEYVESNTPGATLYLNFRATEVNLVMAAPKSKSLVEILLNGKPLPSRIRGLNVEDSGCVTISRSNLYNLIKSDKLVEGVLEIKAKEGAFQAYAFTFSGCK